MSKLAHSPVNQLIAKLRDDIADLGGRALAADLKAPARRKLNQEIQRAALELNALLAELDPIKRPKAVFDPGNPRTIGFFIALAMTAQPRLPLAVIKDVYGAGVYAIYYRGSYPSYAPVSGSETPIYVGKAISARENAREPSEQGASIAGRLNEHRKNIVRTEASLNIDDFEYRALVVQSGWESGAEDYLIRLFRPIWNRETKIIYGFGKHGDSAETRKNKRSSWDTLHEGRGWAGAKALSDAKSPTKIAAELDKHFSNTRVFHTMDDVLAAFVDDLQQT